MTTVAIGPGALPNRLQALGWTDPVFVRGALRDGPAVAIVGARAASQVGMDRAHALARHLAGRGIEVVSGGALGIDGAAHRGALAGGGTTTVVLGSGCDVVYPTRHAALFRAVIDRGGTLASLWRDGTQPLPGRFPKRNQLIAALADLVLVVEADLRSGSLSTAAAGARQGRLLAAWPGSPGCDRLTAKGAALVESAHDLDLALAGTPRQREMPAIDPIAHEVSRAIADGASDLDDIIRRTRLPVRVVLRALAMIERMQ